VISTLKIWGLLHSYPGFPSKWISTTMQPLQIYNAPHTNFQQK